MLHFISLYGKKSSGRHLILVALLLCSLSPSWAQTSVTRLLINGLPCLLDSVATTYYSTLGADPAFVRGERATEKGECIRAILKK